MEKLELKGLMKFSEVKENKWVDFHFDLIKVNTLPEFESLDSFGSYEYF